MYLVVNMKYQKAQSGLMLGFILLAIGLIVGIISYIILNSVIVSSTVNSTAGNFTGINYTIVSYIPTLFLVGILVGAAMAALVVMGGMSNKH